LHTPKRDILSRTLHIHSRTPPVSTTTEEHQPNAPLLTEVFTTPDLAFAQLSTLSSARSSFTAFLPSTLLRYPSRFGHFSAFQPPLSTISFKTGQNAQSAIENSLPAVN